MPTATPVPSAGLSRATGSSAAALIAALISLFVTTLDALIVSVALPSIRHDLGGGITGQQWVVDGYTLALAALLLSAGTIADRIGARQALGWGLALFLAASAACGFAPNLGVLIAARLAQGAGAAVVMPTTLALIRETFALASGKLSAKYGPKPPMLAGQLCMAGGLGLLCLVPATAPVWLLAVLMMPVAFGAALAVPAMTTMLLSSVAPELAGTASGVLNASRQLGGALAIAVFGALTAAFGNFLTGLRISLTISAVLLLLTALAAKALPSAVPATGPRSSSGR